MKFASLHGHTSFSFGDGHGSPKAHVQRAKELGIKALAVTEHGNVSSHVQLEKACKEAGIKPIFGCELYVAPPQTGAKFHQTVLAMTQQGYRQLSRLVTRSYDEGFYRYPTVHPEWLLDPKATSDLIVLSGCSDSWLSCALAGGKSNDKTRIDTAEDFLAWPVVWQQRGRSEAQRIVEDFKDCYDDRYYLELQRFKEYFRTVYLNKELQRLAVLLDVPVVGTADVHYPHPEDWEVQVALNSIAWRVPEEQLTANRDYASVPCTYPLSDREFAHDLHDAGVEKSFCIEAINNSNKIADRCNVELPKTDAIRCSESDGTDEGALKLLKQRIIEGINYRNQTDKAFKTDFAARKNKYVERIRKEMKTIGPKGFADYFLINQQIIGWAKDQGIAVGPGRGSAAGSLICFLLRLTEINPMNFPEMLFERFLDPSREDAPDIDTDYEDRRRNEVFKYARSIYGNENVGNIGNFQQYRGRSAVNDVASSRKIPRKTAETYASLIGTPAFGDPREFKSAEDASERFDQAKEILKQHPELSMAFRIEGDMKTLGVHAAGMVISNVPIYDTCAIYKKTKSNGDEAEVIAFDKRDAAYLNMLKLDCLGLSTMTIIADVIDMVPELTLEKLYALPFDDQKVLKAFADDDLTGIFQFEGRSTRGIVQDIFKDSNRTPDFRVLADINALSRPGSLSSGMTRQYIRVARGEAPQSIHPVVDKVLERTNGCLVYQEQVMHIGKLFGGLSDHEIGRLRKIIGAKQAGGAFDAFWSKFRDGAKDLHGASEEKAREVWDYMAASASYLFNVSHAISYAAVAYWCMYLKCYYPAEFFCASLRNVSKKSKKKDGIDPKLPLLQDTVAHGYTVSPPSPALSGVTWKVNADRTGIVAGFTQIPGVGPKLAESLVALPAEHKTDWKALTSARGFGLKAAQRGEAMSKLADPFGISLTKSVITAVAEAIADGVLPLSPPTVSAATMTDNEGSTGVYLGHVIAIRYIDVIQETCSRENKTPEQVTQELKDPHLSTKAKVICMDSSGVEVHINISRSVFPKMKAELEAKQEGQAVIHAIGRVSTEYGPAIQAKEITIINMKDE